MKIDCVVENADVITQDAQRPRARAVGVHAGRIVGVDEQLDGAVPQRRIDAQGGVVVPGFNDAHAHSVWFGLTLSELDLGRVQDLAEVYDLVSQRAAGAGPDDWIVAAGFNHMAVGGAHPGRLELDRAAGGRPVWIKNSSGHSCVVSSAVFERIGYPQSVADASGVRLGADGSPTGLLEENAMRLVQDLVLPYPNAEIEAALDRATRHYLTEGLCSVTDAGVAGGWIGHSPIELAAYQDAYDDGHLHTRMQPMVTSDALGPLLDAAAGLRGLAGGMRTGLGDDRLRIGPVKVFVDGSLLGSTACVDEPYVGHPANHGSLQADAEEITDHALAAYAAGWSLAMHAIGDRAIDLAIDTIARAQELHGRRPVPNRIEHGGVLRPDQVTRIAAAGIVVVPQPHFITTYGDGMAALLGPERTRWSYRAKSLLDASIVLPGSSDRPVAPGAPLAVMQAAVLRLTESGAAYGPEERLTAAQALRAYTVGSAQATGAGDRKGRIRAGMLADLVILSDDPTTVEADRIATIDVEGTMVGGSLDHDPHGLTSS